MARTREAFWRLKGPGYGYRPGVSLASGLQVAGTSGELLLRGGSELVQRQLAGAEQADGREGRRKPASCSLPRPSITQAAAVLGLPASEAASL